MKSLFPALGFALASAALAQEAPDATKPGVLEGRVVNAKTGQPLRRVNLTLRSAGAAGMAGVVMGANMAAAPYATATDTEGKFRIEKVEPGTYRLTADRQGFIRQEYGARRNSMMGTAIKVAPGRELKGLDLKLTPQAVVTGRVLDEEGEALAGAGVQLLRHGFNQGKQQMMPVSEGQTLDTGEFRVPGLAPGRYWIRATYRGRSAMFAEGPARNAAGKPEEEYVATYYPESSDEAGASAIELLAGQEMSGVDIRLRKARVYRIRGKVAGVTQRLQDVRLMVVPRERGRFMAIFGGTMVKQDGTFEIASVPPGSYSVIALPMSPVRTTMSASGRVAVDVARENVDNVVLTLSGGVTLRGGLRLDPEARQQEEAQGSKTSFASVRVLLSPVDGVAFNTPGANPNEDGSFEIENAGPERYRMRLINLPPGTWLKSIRAGGQEALDSGIDLSAGTPGAVEITLGMGVGQISGIVRDSQQQPAPGSMVTLVPDPMKEERYDLYRLSSADQNGQFTMQGIAPGEYKLFAWEEVDPGRYMDPEFLKPYESGGRKISIKANGQEQVTLRQIPAEEAGAK